MLRIFISYSHKDRRKKNQLLDHLKILVKEEVEFWDDERIATGKLWDEEIKKNIENSQIAVLLISNDFLVSPYCQEEEVASFLELRRKAGLRLFPVILYACDWKNLPWLSQTQHFPKEKPLGDYASKAKQAAVYNNLLEELRRAISDVRSASSLANHANLFPKSDFAALFDDIFNPDPLVSVPATETLISSENIDINTIIAQIKKTNLRLINQIIVRNVLKRFPKDAAPLILEIIMSASENWYEAIFMADCLDVVHKPYCASNIAETLQKTSDPDLGRVCIEALGYLGASEWGFAILDVLRGKNYPIIGYYTSEYDFGKYCIFALKALSKIFVLECDKHRISDAFDKLEMGLHFAINFKAALSNYQKIDTVNNELIHCKARHSDLLIFSLA